MEMWYLVHDYEFCNYFLGFWIETFKKHSRENSGFYHERTTLTLTPSSKVVLSSEQLPLFEANSCDSPSIASNIALLARPCPMLDRVYR